MSHPDFKRRGNKLGRVIEECAEVLHASGKIIRFGWRSYNPLPNASREVNEDWLRREILDMQDAINQLAKSRGWD